MCSVAINISKQIENVLERVHKVVVNLTTINKIQKYSESLKQIYQQILKEIRKMLSVIIAEKCHKKSITKEMFEQILINKCDLFRLKLQFVIFPLQIKVQ